MSVSSACAVSSRYDYFAEKMSQTEKAVAQHSNCFHSGLLLRRYHLKDAKLLPSCVLDNSEPFDALHGRYR